jgi:hypothetical protein
MPTETHYVDGGKGMQHRCHGVMTSIEILAMARMDAVDVEATRKLKYFLYDMSGVTDLQISTDTVAKLVESNRAIAEFSKGLVGAVVAPNPLAFGMSRMWQNFAYDIDWKVQVFQDRAVAIQWLREQLGDGDAEIDYPSLKIED